ncbi:hypothetical protein Hanom_Chr00s127181g01813911 [Helianthus anomalus]
MWGFGKALGVLTMHGGTAWLERCGYSARHCACSQWHRGQFTHLASFCVFASHPCEDPGVYGSPSPPIYTF